MLYRVTFDQPVVYQPNHPSARKVGTAILVHAPSAEAAKVHAIRVVEGDVANLRVEEVGVLRNEEVLA